MRAVLRSNIALTDWLLAHPNVKIDLKNNREETVLDIVRKKDDDDEIRRLFKNKGLI